MKIVKNALARCQGDRMFAMGNRMQTRTPQRCTCYC